MSNGHEFKSRIINDLRQKHLTRDDIKALSEGIRLQDEKIAALISERDSLLMKIKKSNESTEQMIDAARPFFLGWDLGIRNFEDMREHWRHSGHSIDAWPEYTKTATGHTTKAWKADLVWTVMEAARNDTK